MLTCDLSEWACTAASPRLLADQGRTLLFAFTRQTPLPCLLCTFVEEHIFLCARVGFRTQNSTSQHITISQATSGVCTWHVPSNS
jgi:hypothetical protein